MSTLRYKYGNKWAAWRCRFARSAHSFLHISEPRSIGCPTRGQQILDGAFLFAGHFAKHPNASPWALSEKNPEFIKELHGFTWLDHLMAVGNTQAHKTAQKWFWEWLENYNNGRGPGWTPQLTGRRVMRQIHHAETLLKKQSTAKRAAYFKILGQQANFLAYRWHAEPPGLARFEALTGLLYCGLTLKSKQHLLTPSMQYLGTEALQYSDEKGAIPSRNSEELMTIFSLLAWSAHAITDAKKQPEYNHILAMERIAPCLRTLRLGDGGLVHFHASGRGIARQLDQALADSSINFPTYQTSAMGYQRIAQADMIVVMDCGKQTHYKSPLAFEISVGRNPLIVNMGPGKLFGTQWEKTSQHTMAHSAITVANALPSTHYIKTLPKVERSKNATHEIITASHTGYSHSHGITHYRHLEVARDGTGIQGCDIITAQTNEEKIRFSSWLTQHKENNLPFTAVFHIAPNVNVQLDEKGHTASLELPNGILWILQSENARLYIKNSYYIHNNHLTPCTIKQVIIKSSALNYNGTIYWSLTKLTK